MRLSEQQCSIIRTAVADNFGTEANVWLFGSRLDDAARGGDIDLYIEPATDDADAIVEAKLNFLVALYKQLGEQKIDVVIRRPGFKQNLSIYQVAKQTGVKLS
ncbi:MAG: DNA polymerase III subunit beta [Gallionellales bacterium RIFOXYB12_FULL_54_9]|nr:MAG: DNA polymerase III subunit beta [Gallionellales bacterium RIFOXYB12_FULL_54_9]